MSQPASQPTPRIKRTVLRNAWRGVKVTRDGLRMWSTSRRLMAWGLVPGAITLWVFGVGALVIAFQVGGWARSIADALVSTEGFVHGTVQLVAGLAIVAAAIVIGIYTFTAVTLTVGQVFFERISRTVDQTRGFAGADSDERWYRSLLRAGWELLRLALLTVPLAVLLFVVGFIPVVGAVASFILGAIFGGWFLALELTTYPLERRGIVTLSQRRAVLRPHRATVVGFGASVFLLFLIPLGPALFMPAAVAGATRLVQETAGTAALSVPTSD